MKPRRIQLSRKKEFKLPRNTVVVSRPSQWGNPHAVTPRLIEMCGSKMEAQMAVVQAYRGWLYDSPAGKRLLARIQPELRGKNLACWCAPDMPCHADVLLEIANGEPFVIYDLRLVREKDGTLTWED